MPARSRAALLILLAVAGGSVFAALALGSMPAGLAEVLGGLTGAPGTAEDVVRMVRLPRVLAAFATGGLLALAGALMQVLLRNPLADPYVLGISGGAAVGALSAMMAGLGVLAVDAGAALGALAAVLLVFALARREFARIHLFSALDASPRLLLTGVILAAGWSAVITLMLTLAPEARLRGMLFWLMGDLNGAESWLPAFVALLAVLVLTYPSARDLNVMLRGEAMAQSLGVRVAKLRRTVYIAASAATALAVTTAGAIAFVGLVVPHALRLVLGNDQRVLLPASAMAGGTLLVLADTAARTAFSPQEVPVGVITALLGVPMFMALLARSGAPR